MLNKTKITIVGSGYVGMSLAVLFAQFNEVNVLDIDKSRVDKINKNQSTVEDAEIEAFLAQKELNLIGTLDKKVAYTDASFIVVATPTNYDPINNYFDTSSVDSVVAEALHLNEDAIVIKSTIPIGHTKLLQKNIVQIALSSPRVLARGASIKR